MSIASWKKEFYPVPACKIVDPEKAFQHSYRQWQGLTKKNLKKHELCFDNGCLFDRRRNTRYWITCALDCALCKVYFYGKTKPCVGCPLHENGFNCTHRNSPYYRSYNNNTAAPMLRAFRTVIARKAKQQAAQPKQLSAVVLGI